MEVQTKLGWQVNTWAVGDLVKVMNAVTEEEIDTLMADYTANYDIATDNIAAIRYHARTKLSIYPTAPDTGGLTQLGILECVLEYLLEWQNIDWNYWK